MRSHLEGMLAYTSFLAPTAERPMSLRSLLDDGFALIPGAISSRDCDAAVEAFYSFVSCNQDYSDGFLLKSGLHSRLANLHIWSESVRRLCLNPKVLDLCDEFLGANAAICSSLYFEQGSEQAVHRDTLFFSYTTRKKVFRRVVRARRRGSFSWSFILLSGWSRN